MTTCRSRQSNTKAVKIMFASWEKQTSEKKLESNYNVQYEVLKQDSTVSKGTRLMFRVYYEMGFLPDTSNCGLRMSRKCRERFPRHHGLAIQTCITARAWRTCRDACRDR